MAQELMRPSSLRRWSRPSPDKFSSVRKWAALALIAALVGGGASPLRATQTAGVTPSALSHQFIAGEKFKYQRETKHSAPDGIHRATLSLAFSVVSVKAGSVSGALAWDDSDPDPKDRKGTEDIVASGDGTWRASDGTQVANFVTLDPRTNCPAPPTLSVGATWSCDVAKIGTYPAGTQTVRVVSLEGSRVTLGFSGQSSVKRATEINRDTNEPVQTSRVTRWHGVLIFDAGILVSDTRSEVTQLDYGGTVISVGYDSVTKLIAHSP